MDSNKGFVIMAQGDVYVKCAKALELSIKNTMPDANVTTITTDMLPHGNLGGYVNDWQVYECSPYEYTIKLESDMYIPKSIDYWFDILKERDVVVCTRIKNFMQEDSDVKFYRNFIVGNKLPDTYNAITYFKKSELAEKFYKIVRNIFENWDDYRQTLVCNKDEPATTDWVYAIACHILGEESTTLPNFEPMSLIHMKQHINRSLTENWTDTFVAEILPHTLRINTFAQLYPFHYHIKSFADTILEELQ